MEEALYDTTILRPFAGLSLERIPDETTILNEPSAMFQIHRVGFR